MKYIPLPPIPKELRDVQKYPRKTIVSLALQLKNETLPIFETVKRIRKLGKDPTSSQEKTSLLEAL